MTDDLISRQAAIDVLGVFTQTDALGHTPKQIVEALPSAQPERKTGKWIHIGGDEWCCDKCGNVITTEGSWEHPISEERKAYYCNICGADMRGEQDD